jgi:predicted HicB family RNase H-like nuclease
MGQDATSFGNVSDSVTRPRREKLVEVSIAIPKSLRKKLKSDARAKGISVNELIALRLNEY